MKSIKTKLIVSFSFLTLVITMVIGLISLRSGYQALKGEAEKSLKLLAAEGAKLTESRIEALVSTLNMIAMKQEVKDMGWEIEVAVLKEELVKTNFLDIGYVLPNGYTYYTDGTVRLMSDRKYIQEALNGNQKISDVIISRVTRKPEIEISVPVIKNGEVVGALVGRKEADSLGRITEDAGYGANGYAYMMNGKGTMIAHPNTDLVIDRFNPTKESKEDQEQASLAKAFQRMLQEKSGIISYQQENINLYAGFAPVNGTDWTFVITAEEQEVLAVIPKMVRTMITGMMIVFLFSIVLVYIMDHSITRPLIELTKHSKQIADFNVRENISEAYLSQKDEIGTLSGAFQTLTENLRDIILEITKSANQVTDTAQELTLTSQQSSQVTSEISRTVEEIAKNASEQANTTQAGSEQATFLGQMIEKNHEHMINLNTTTNEVTTLVNGGLMDIERLSLITQENEGATKEICDIILQTKLSSEQIGEASKVISEMAKQTNLVALNATIEAARAGDAGRGFAVVADEIQRMADQSSESTKYIDDIVLELQGNVKKAVESMKRISITSNEQQRSVSNTINKYRSIANSMKISGEAVKELNTSEKDMSLVKKEILTLLKSLTAIAEQNAAGTQQASCAMEEQTASAKEIADASDRLSGLANNLLAATVRFNI